MDILRLFQELIIIQPTPRNVILCAVDPKQVALAVVAVINVEVAAQGEEENAEENEEENEEENAEENVEENAEENAEENEEEVVAQDVEENVENREVDMPNLDRIYQALQVMQLRMEEIGRQPTLQLLHALTPVGQEVV